MRILVNTPMRFPVITKFDAHITALHDCCCLLKGLLEALEALKARLENIEAKGCIAKFFNAGEFFVL
jgi:hypothetical protein